MADKTPGGRLIPEKTVSTLSKSCSNPDKTFDAADKVLSKAKNSGLNSG
jgi:PleD family two-component response regulator